MNGFNGTYIPNVLCHGNKGSILNDQIWNLKLKQKEKKTDNHNNMKQTKITVKNFDLLNHMPNK